MIRLRRQNLPRGLSAVVRRDQGGDLEIFVSQALSPERQRAAVRVALRAARQAGWRAWPLRAPVVALLAAAGAALRALRGALSSHAIAATAAAVSAAAVTAGLVVITTLPHHAPVNAGKPPANSQQSAPTRMPGQGRAAASTRPRAGLSSRPVTGVQPSGQPVSQPSAPAPAASPQTSSLPPAPTPDPSPSSTGGSGTGGSGRCLVLLGIRLCL